MNAQDMESLMIIGFIVVAIVGLRLGAGMHNALGSILRWFWNASFTIAAFIPFMGWMSHFIIADTREEKAAKQELIRTGEAVDDSAYNFVGEQAEQERRRQREYERLSSIARTKYDSTVVSYDAESGRAKLSNGKVIRMKRDN